MRGMIESFYGPPYTFEARLDLIRFLPRAGLDAYLYAPKDDRYHRDRWRDPYPAEFIAHFAEAARLSREQGVRFIFALSPGGSFDPDSGDFAAIEDKLGALYTAGVRDFCILFDDLSPESLAANPALQVEIVNASRDFLRGLDADNRLCFISHYYAGSVEEMRSDRALFSMSFDIPSSVAYAAYAAIPDDVPILWTGRRVFADQLTTADVADFQSFVARPLLIWDNYPVNDVLLSREMFLAPYRRREPGITAVTDGVLLNTMLQPEASKLALWTAGRFFAEGERYDAQRAFDEALEVVAGSRTGGRVVARLAEHFRSHPVIGNDSESPQLVARAEAFFRTRSADDEQALRELLQSFAAMQDDLERDVENAALVAELREPVRKLAFYGSAGLRGLDELAAAQRGEPANEQAVRDILAQATAINWLVGANTILGPPLDDFLGGRPAQRADAFGDFFRQLFNLI